MGVWHRLIALASLGLMTQACVQHTAAVPTDVTFQQINPLKKFHPKSSIEALTPEVAGGINTYADTRLNDQCERESWVPWCDQTQARKNVRRLTAEQLKAVSHNVYDHFSYVADGVDSWNSYVAIVEQNHVFFGDCDDITSTTLNALQRAGQPLNKMWMLLVNVESHGTLDHIIGVVQDANGRYWVVGDTNPTNVYPLADLTYSPRAMVRMDDRHHWQSALEAPVMQNYPEKLGYHPKQ